MKLFFLFKKWIGHRCPIHALTGAYCPGCGGTRAIILLLHGHPLLSFIMHPFVLYFVVTFIFGFFLYLFTRKKQPALFSSYRSVSLWGGLFLILLNFLIKNTALLLGCDILTQISVSVP